MPKPKTGRPPVPHAQKHGARWATKLTPSQDARAEAARKKSGRTKADWLRTVVLAATGAA